MLILDEASDGMHEFFVQFLQIFYKSKSISKKEKNLIYKLNAELVSEDRDRSLRRFMLIVHLSHELENSLRVFTTNKQNKKKSCYVLCWRNNYDD